MTQLYVLNLGREAILVTLLVAAPMLGIGLLVGLSISIIQAVTQINEMTLTFIPKIIAVALSLMFFLPWIMRFLVTFSRELFTSIQFMGG